MGKTPESGPLVYEDEDPVVDENAAQLDGNLDQEISAGDLLRLVEELQKRFDYEEIDFDEYEERIIELLARLPMDYRST